MSVTIGEIEGEFCRYEKESLAAVYVDLSHWEEPTCITLKQDDDWIDLTPRMIADLIEILQKHQK